MNRRCITRTVGAVAGGLLGAAFLPTAIACADDYTIIPDPGSTEVITGLYGLQTAPPAVEGSVQGYQTFEITGTGGTFGADESNATDMFGNVNEELLVTSTSGAVGTAAGDVPPVGSVFDYSSFGDSGYANVYSDLASTTPGGDVITDTLVTPFGDINIPVTLDAAAGLPTALADAPLGTTAIGGRPPLDVAVQYQLTDLNHTPLGAVDGTFAGDETTTADAFGFSTNELLVVPCAADAGCTDVPPAGSVFNTISFGGGWENDYSAIPSTGGGDVLTDTLVTPFGNVDIPVDFDAAALAGAVAPSVPLSGGYELTPVGAEAFTGVNGVPPLDVAVQGTQGFDVDGLADSGLQTDLSTSVDGFGNVDQAILVTNAPDLADVPQDGSVFDIYTLGDSGFYSIYSDLITSTGANVFSETLVTPLGDITIPLTEALAGFGVDSFLPIPF